jgi:hypothetical protein
VLRVLEREECYRGRSGGSSGEGGVVGVPEGEGCWECWRGRGGGSAGEGGVVKVLERSSCK